MPLRFLCDFWCFLTNESSKKFTLLGLKGSYHIFFFSFIFYLVVHTYYVKYHSITECLESSITLLEIDKAISTETCWTATKDILTVNFSCCFLRLGFDPQSVCRDPFGHWSVNVKVSDLLDWGKNIFPVHKASVCRLFSFLMNWPL